MPVLLPHPALTIIYHCGRPCPMHDVCPVHHSSRSSSYSAPLNPAPVHVIVLWPLSLDLLGVSQTSLWSLITLEHMMHVHFSCRVKLPGLFLRSRRLCQTEHSLQERLLHTQPCLHLCGCFYWDVRTLKHPPSKDNTTSIIFLSRSLSPAQ